MSEGDSSMSTFQPQVVTLTKDQITDLVAGDLMDRAVVRQVIDALDFFGLLVREPSPASTDDTETAA